MVKNIRNSIKCWICDNVHVDGDVKVRGNPHITEKYKGFAYIYIVKLNHKILIIFHNIKKL